MKIWVQQDFTPVATDYSGEDIYGYICIAPQDQQETEELLHFLEDHGMPIDWEDGAIVAE